MSVQGWKSTPYLGTSVLLLSRIPGILPTFLRRYFSKQHVSLLSPSHVSSTNSRSIQVRNPRNHLADFQAELPLYERSGALVEFLLAYRQENRMSSIYSGLTPCQVEGLAVTMFEHGIVEEEDVILTQVGI